MPDYNLHRVASMALGSTCSALGCYGAFEFAYRLEGSVSYLVIAAPVVALAAALIPPLAEATWRSGAYLKSLLWWLVLVPAGASTRRAMREFLDRVNASLPTEQPDAILLALAQAQPGTVCGVPCPTGQDLNSAGQCVPSPLLARRGGSKVASMMTRERAAPTTSAWTITTLAGPPGLEPAAHERLEVSTPPATAPPKPHAPRRAAERRQQPSASSDRGWAYNFLRQRAGYSFY